MSTKKDGVKTSSLSKKKITSVSQTSTRIREESTDGSNSKKTEVSNKTKTKPPSLTSLRDKSLDSSRVKPQISRSVSKTEKPLKASSSLNEKKGASNTTLLNDKKVASNATKRNTPLTPTSNRVSKTQYFPTKNMYSNALKIDGETPNNIVASTSRETKNNEARTKISNKISVDKERNKIGTKKVISEKDRSSRNILEKRDTYRAKVRQNTDHKDISPDLSSLSERPRTATLRKGSIVNANIVGPDVPKPPVPEVIKEAVKVKTPSPKHDRLDEYNYEDDFESYESDFEEYSSSTSTNLDNISGEETSSISSSQSRNDLPLPRELKSAQKRVASAGTDEERKLDSGNFDMPDYKHKQMLDNIKESVERENANLKMQEVQRNNPASLSDEGFEEQKSLQFINFLDAKKKYAHRKSMEIKRKRGEDILNMIRLDTCSYTLFDLPPVPYEVFIKNFGRSNTIQTAVQTNEDNISEEIQTEEIISGSRWTQFPVCFSKIESTDPNYWQIYKSDYLGTGSDKIVEEKTAKKSNSGNSLNKFLLSAGSLILKLQTESILENYEKVQNNTRDIPFSDGYILFNTSTDVFKDCSVKCLSFCCDNNNTIMTVHVRRQRENEGYGSVVCIWNIGHSDEPEIFFISYGQISCCSFGLNSSDFIYAGLNDGTISVWNTKRKIYNEDSFLKRIPLFATEIGFGHNTKVVSLQPFINHIEKTACFQSKQTNEICSLDEEGDIILWSVIMKHDSSSSNTQASSTNWSDVVLAKNTRISLKILHPELEDLQCTDFVVNTVNSNYVFVSTNYGFIIHHLIKGGRSNVRKFVPESESIANCLETCPFSSNYFLAGFNNGNINLYSRLVEKPLMVFSDKEGDVESCGIQMIQWSRNKPFIMYTKDGNNTINIWDLNQSDMYPAYSIPFKDDITCMQLSNSAMENTKKSYMMIGTEDGHLYLHVLSGEHAQQPSQVYTDHVNTFIKYINRL